MSSLPVFFAAKKSYTAPFATALVVTWASIASQLTIMSLLFNETGIDFARPARHDLAPAPTTIRVQRCSAHNTPGSRGFSIGVNVAGHFGRTVCPLTSVADFLPATVL